MTTIKKLAKKRSVRKAAAQKARGPKRRRGQVPEAGTYVTEKHWELW